MNENLTILLIISILIQYTISDYILPFKTINIGINKTLLEEDFLSNILSRYLSTKFIIGSNKETINVIFNMSQIGFYIYEDAYKFNSSYSFKITNKLKTFIHKNYEKGYAANDTLCLVEYNSKNNLNELDINKCNIFNEVNFELLKSEQDIEEENYFKKYGIIGLGLFNNQDEYIVSTFIKALKNTNMTNSHYFSYNFINNYKSGEIEGYVYIGQEEQDEDKGIKNKVVSFPISGQFFWNLKFLNIYSVINNSFNTSNNEYYKNFEIKIAELIADLPYIIGIKSYRLYIDAYFFNEFKNENICSLRKIKLDNDYSTFVCDNSSKLFREKLEHKFPKLYFEHYELNKTFVLDYHDLFTYNYLDKSDKNIYFLVLFSEKKGKYYPYNPSKNEIQRWKLGIPFFKKYKLILNSDSKEISYYEPFCRRSNENGNEKTKKGENGVKGSNSNLYLYLEIGGAVLLLIIFFILGFLFHKNIIKIPRKKKANELEDEYEYSINPSEAYAKKASLNNYEIVS